MRTFCLTCGVVEYVTTHKHPYPSAEPIIAYLISHGKNKIPRTTILPFQAGCIHPWYSTAHGLPQLSPDMSIFSRGATVPTSFVFSV